jgi:hypothetical protein
VAKQKEDTKTVDMIGIKRGRGRPASAAPQTEAERKAAYRARKRAEGAGVPVSFVLPADLVAAFDAYLVGHRDKIGPITRDQALEKILRNQVMRKR